MTEMHAATVGAPLMQGEAAPAARKQVSPQSPSHGQHKAKMDIFLSTKVFCTLVYLAAWRTLSTKSTKF